MRWQAGDLVVLKETDKMLEADPGDLDPELKEWVRKYRYATLTVFDMDGGEDSSEDSIEYYLAPYYSGQQVKKEDVSPNIFYDGEFAKTNPEWDQ